MLSPTAEDGEIEVRISVGYVEYFSGLLSGNIRINSAPLYLTHVTVLGAPSFEVAADDGSGGGGCRAFLKVYEGLVPVYTSGVHSVAGGTRQFTGGIAPPPSHAQGAQGSRELVFSCQFHTCAVTDYTLSFTRQELDHACNDLRFPLDGAVELHFSPTPEVRLPSPAPTPAVPVHLTDDPVTRWDSYENITLLESPDSEGDDDGANRLQKQGKFLCL
uniref:C2 tensin-type domain-containing protein n=1 Tax=Timema genevievae TaxID=629358 RepID=A0A7R9JQI9_TIMGE|nr:unnamed protein product [Timema genevievae]